MSALSDIGLVDVTESPYSADNTGVVDATSDIQDAMDYAYPNEMAVFFPSGTYKITDTLWGISDENNYRDRAHLLIGSTAGDRPVLKLSNSASGFNDTNNPKAVVHLYTPTDEENPDPDDDKHDMGMNGGMRGVDIEVGTGNTGAVGLRHAAAQECLVENVTVIMNSGFAGFYYLPGTNAVVMNLRVEGGKYGVYCPGSDVVSAVQGLTLIDQTDYALYALKTVPVITGLYIEKDTAPAVFVNDGSWSESYSAGCISLIDGIIKIASATSTPVIENDDGRGVVLKNMYFENANVIIESDSVQLAGGTGWYLVDKYANTIKDLAYDDSNQIGRTLIDGVGGTANISPAAQSVTGVPAGFITRHTTDDVDYPSADVILTAIAAEGTINGKTVCNIANEGVTAAPTGMDSDSRAGTDCTTALQAALDTYDIVFFPKGKYLVSSTITLNANNIVLSPSNYMAGIAAHEDWAPTSGSPGTIVQTVDSSSANTIIAYFRLDYPTETDNDWFTAINWRAGRNSIFKNVMIRPIWNGTEGGNPKNDIEISGNGGGRFYGLGALLNGNRTHHNDHRRLYVDNTTEPLIFYGLNPEDGHEDDPDGFQVEFNGCENIAIYNSKSEDKHDILFADCDNVITFGATGSVEMYFEDCTRVFCANLGPKKWTAWQQPTTLDSRKILTEDYFSTVVDFRADRVIALLTRGTADFTAFIFDAPVPPIPPIPPPSQPLRRNWLLSEIKVRWFNVSGVMQAEHVDYLSLAYTTGVNRPGIANIIYAGNHSIVTDVADKWRFEVWRRNAAHSLDWVREFEGLFRAIDLEGTAPGKAVLICPGSMHMLTWRHVLWYAGMADRSAFSSEKAETILKTLVTYNATSSASTGNSRLRDGDLSVISVQSDGAGGNTISHYCSWASLLDTLQNVAVIAGGDFDLVKTAVNAWQFRWYAGQLGTDRSATVTFADSLGNMGNPRYIENHIKEKTVVLAAGKGEGEFRETEIRTSSDYHGSTNNIEIFADARNVAEGNTVGLQAVADKKLDDQKLKSEFSFDVLQTPAAIYGVHYFLGDLVSVVNPFSESKETKKIDTVTVAQESSGNVSIKVEVENA